MAEPKPIGRTLEQFLEHMGAPPVSTVSTLASRWAEIVGPALANNTRPVEVVDGVLVVACDDAMWSSQIGWMDGQIKTRFAEVFDGLEIRRVSARISS